MNWIQRVRAGGLLRPSAEKDKDYPLRTRSASARRTADVCLLAVLALSVVAQDVGAASRFTRERYSPALAWTGKRLFVFGGQDSSARRPERWLRNDAVLIAPRSGRAEQLPSASFDSKLWEPAAAVAKGKVVVVGTSCRAIDGGEEGFFCPRDAGYAAAVYDLSDRSWEDLSLPRAVGRVRNGTVDAVGSLGARAIFEFRGNTFEQGDIPQYWAYSTRSGNWDRLPDPGFPSEDLPCFVDHELVLLRLKYQERGVISDEDPTPGSLGSGKFYVHPSLARLDPNRDDAWRSGSVAEDFIAESGPPHIECMGSRVALVDSIRWTNLRIYDAQRDRWSALAPPPSNVAALHSERQVWVGDELVVQTLENDDAGLTVAYNPETDTWRDLGTVPAIPFNALRAGRAIVGYDGSGVYYFVP